MYSESPENSIEYCTASGVQLDDLRPKPLWVAWRFETRNGKATKVPADPRTGRGAKSNDPATWSDFRTASKFANEKRCEGVGLMLAAIDEDLSIGGVDLDSCRAPDGTI